MNMKTIVLILVAITLGGFVIGGAILAGSTDFTFEQPYERVYDDQTLTFDPSIRQLSVEVNSMNVVVKPSLDDALHLRLTGKSNSKTLPELNLYTHDGQFVISVSDPVQLELFTYENLQLEVFVPNNYHEMMDVVLQSGSMDVTGLDVELLILDTKSGNIALTDINTPSLTFGVNSGNAVLENINTTYMLGGAGSGRVTGNALVTTGMQLQINSGNIELQFDRVEEAILVNARSGNVALDLPDDEMYAFKLNAASGNINNELEDRSVIELQGDVANAITIDARVTSGNIDIS